MLQPLTDRGSRLLAHVREWPPLVQDLLLAALVSEADLIVVLLEGTTEGVAGTLPLWVAALIVMLISAPLVFRRHSPDLTIMLTGFGAGGALVLGVPVQALAPIVALYTVAAYGPLADAVISTVIFLLISGAAITVQGELSRLYSNVLLIVGITVVGRIVQAYRQQTEVLAERNAQLERQREERVGLGARAERARIAREMHDILGHSVSVMVVQASGARRLLPDKPARAAEALAVIEDTGRSSLVEIRRVLGLLREGAEGERDGVPSVSSPQPGLQDLDALIAELEEAGLDIDLRLGRGVFDRVGTTVQLSAYRIVQEALTNVLKHAGPTRVVVQFRNAGGRLHVEVIDSGRRIGGAGPVSSSQDDGRGFGLLGMRERAALVGGTLEAGPRPGGGFRVIARLPEDLAVAEEEAARSTAASHAAGVQGSGAP